MGHIFIFGFSDVIPCVCRVVKSEVFFHVRLVPYFFIFFGHIFVMFEGFGRSGAIEIFGGDFSACGYYFWCGFFNGDGDGFVGEDSGFDGVLKDHAANGKLLSLAKGVVFVEFGVVDPLVHDIFVLKEGHGCVNEVR